MINYTERHLGPYMNDPYLGAYEFTEEGDTLVVSPSTPVLGLSNILSNPTILQEHENADGSFLVTVRLSADEGLSWTDPIPASSLSSAGLLFKTNHYVVFEFTICKQGSGKSWFEGIEFNDSLDFSLPPVPEFYGKMKNELQLPYYNHESIQWAINVLEKVFKKGIVPSFIKRANNKDWSDEDYINLWWAFLYPIALRTAMANEFSDLLWHPVLVEHFLKQRGLILGNISGLDELYYLMTHFYDEISRRGTLSIFDTDRDVEGTDNLRGEAARLIDLKIGSELFLGLISPYENGWWVGKSSFCDYENSDIYENYRLGYENKVTSLDNYPLVKGTSDSITLGSKKIYIAPAGDTYTGIGGDFSCGKLIPVVKDREYAIIIECETTATSNQMGVDFGVVGYDSAGNQVNFIDSGGSTQNTFFKNAVAKGKHCFIGYIRRYDCTSLASPDGISRVLRFPNLSVNASYIVPKFTVNKSGETCIITDFKVCLLRPKFIYLESTFGKVYGMLIKNNNMNLTDEEVDSIIKTKLLPMGIDYTLTFE